MRTCCFFPIQFTAKKGNLRSKLLGGGVPIGVRHHTCTSWRFGKAADGDEAFCIGNLVFLYRFVWVPGEGKKPGMFEVNVSF